MFWLSRNIGVEITSHLKIILDVIYMSFNHFLERLLATHENLKKTFCLFTSNIGVEINAHLVILHFIYVSFNHFLRRLAATQEYLKKMITSNIGEINSHLKSIMNFICNSMGRDSKELATSILTSSMQLTPD